jgi:hypothetical protein
MLVNMTVYFNQKLKVNMNFTLAVLDEPQWTRVVSTIQRRGIFALEKDKPPGLEPFRVPYGTPLAADCRNQAETDFARRLEQSDHKRRKRFMRDFWNGQKI